MTNQLTYLVREPKIQFAQNPLIVLLHGYGSNEHDLFSFADALPDSHFVISLQAPHDLQFGSYAWYAINFDADENKFSDLEQAKDSRELVMNCINDLKIKYSIDSSDITLIGFSQGAILSYAIGLSYPEKIKRVVAMSGYFNEKIAVEGFEKKNFSNLKIFASHGSADPVVPVIWARKAQPQLQQLGLGITYREYPAGHTISQQNFADMLAWLQKN